MPMLYQNMMWSNYVKIKKKLIFMQHGQSKLINTNQQQTGSLDPSEPT